MGIASGIFWIAIGAIYILYMAFKENQGDTAFGVALFLLLECVIIGWTVSFRLLLSWNLTAGMIFGALSIGAVVCYFVRINIIENRKRMDYTNRFERALRIAKEEPINELDLKKYEETFWREVYDQDPYAEEKKQYMCAKDKSAFRDLIVKDYIENHRVYEIMQRL